MNEVPDVLLPLFFRHLDQLKDQKNLASVSQRFFRMAYKGSTLFTHAQATELQNMRDEAKALAVKNDRARVKDNGIYRKMAEIHRAVEKPQFELDLKSTLLGRTYFAEILNDPLAFIRGVDLKNEVKVAYLRQIEDVIDREIPEHEFLVELMTAKNMEKFVEKHKGRLVDEYHAEHNDEDAVPSDKDLLDTAKNMAEGYDILSLQQTLVKLIQAKNRVNGIPAQLAAPDEEKSFGSSPASPRSP